MVSLPVLLAAADGGLSGSAVRGAVVAGAQDTAAAVPQGLEQTVAAAAEQMQRGLDMATQTMQGVGIAAEKAAQSVPEPVSALGHSSFSWGNYIQAVGILFLLVAILWLAVWLARRFGKFNFLPRPGSLPRDALVMEAQLPLGPRKGLMVVRFLNRRLLLGVTDQQITLLTEEQAQHEPENPDFQQIMEQARRGADGS